MIQVGHPIVFAFFLDNGITQDFSPNIMVIPVDAEIIVSYSENRREL